MLLGISGSLRTASTNTLLMRNAARVYGAEEVVEADLDFPLFNEDLQNDSGIPAPVQTLSDQIDRAEAVIISTPEYNKAPPGALKNALDWVSRTEGNPWKDKPVAIMSATAGRAGGERTQFALRLMMVAFRPRILQGPEVLLGGATDHFDEDGTLVTESYVTFLTDLMESLKAEVGRG